MKLGYHKVRKVTAADFPKNLNLEILALLGSKWPKIRVFVNLPENGSNDFSRFWPEVSTKYS